MPDSDSDTTPETAVPPSSSALRAVRFKDRIYALGAAVNYLMTKPAFARLPFGHWSRVLTGQMNRGHYFFVLKGDEVVGFAGWALASAEDAEAWVAGRSNPAFEKGGSGNCIILNAWDAATPEANRMLLDQIRRIGKDKDMVYAKREYPDGRSRPLRLSVNEFVEGHVEAGKQRNATEEPGPAP